VDAANLPRYLRREHRAWIWTARTLRSGSARLPRPYVEGGVKPGRRLRLALAGVVAVLVLIVMYTTFKAAIETQIELQRQQQQQQEAEEPDSAFDPR
jgi:hypothetical protein